MELNGQEINDLRAQASRDGNLQQVLSYTSPKPDRVAKNGLTSGSNSKTSLVRYRECLRNHAANVGGNVFDGCGEFMPAGEEGTIEALKCAACQCHRNFHRKQVDGESSGQFSASSRRCMVPSLQLPVPLPSPTVLHHQKYIHANPIQSMNVGFGGTGTAAGGGGNESSSEDLNAFHSNVEGMVGAPPHHVLSKKRHRTKFTPEQKERMFQFAESIEWRISKQVEEQVNSFCAEAGVKRQVFKVWMHNNKNNVKKQTDQEPPLMDQEDLKKDNI